MRAYNIVGVDGNAFALIGYTIDAMKHAFRCVSRQQDEDGIRCFGRDAQKELRDKCMSGSYDNVVCLCYEMCTDVNEYLGLDEEE